MLRLGYYQYLLLNLFIKNHKHMMVRDDDDVDYAS